jgi:hypothetical protein
VSSGVRGCLEQSEEVAGEVALEEADRFAFALSLAPSTLDVGDRARVVLASCDHDLVQDGVEFAVAAAVEPVTDRLAGGGRDRWRAGQAREGGFAAEASLVGPGNECLRGADRPDAALVEQCGSKLRDLNPTTRVTLSQQDLAPHLDGQQRQTRRACDLLLFAGARQGSGQAARPCH